MEIKRLPAGDVYTVQPTLFDARVGGVRKAEFCPGGRVTLTYENGRGRETAQFTPTDAQALIDAVDGGGSWFALVAAVQAVPARPEGGGGKRA